MDIPTSATSRSERPVAPHRLPSFFRSPQTHLTLVPSHVSCVRQCCTPQTADKAFHHAPENSLKPGHVDHHPLSYSECQRDSGFSRHDSLFSFGASSARNAAELKSLLGSSSSRLRRGATVLSRHTHSIDTDTCKAHAVSLEQAKPRARVEVDILLESDCLVEGGYLRGNIKVRVRKRQKKEAPVLLADGRVRLIGFECAAGDLHRHTFYQRASPLSAITDAHARLYDSPPDEEGFARAMEGIHTLPFAMHLPGDEVSGSPKGSIGVQSGVALRYIAMISVKVKDSETSRRSIAHFYRDCQVWPRFQLHSVLASSPQPIQASATRNLSVVNSGGQLELTAMLHRSTWIAGQRCTVRICVGNETKKTVKTVTLSLIRTTTLFKSSLSLDPGNPDEVEKDASLSTTTHKIVAESTLERSSPTTKNHASAEGWWTGVQAGQETYFSHFILLPADALSVPRSRLLEVEYNIRITASAGALTPDVHVTLPLHIINFLSVDPMPSEPLLSMDGSYTRLIPHMRSSRSPVIRTAASPSILKADDNGSTCKPPSLMVSPNLPSQIDRPCLPIGDTPSHSIAEQSSSRNVCGETSEVDAPQPHTHGTATPSASESEASMYSTDSYMSTASASSSRERDQEISNTFEERNLGNLELDESTNSSDKISPVLNAAQTDLIAHSGSYACTASGHFITNCKAVGVRDSQDDHTPSGNGTRTVILPHAPNRSRNVVGHLPSDRKLFSDSSRTAQDETISSAQRLSGRLAEHNNMADSAADIAVGECAEDDDAVKTPTLRPTASTTVSGTSGKVSLSLSCTPLASGLQLQRRPTRALPRPPDRTPRKADIPATVSALDAFRLSWMEPSCLTNAPMTNATVLHLPAPPSDLYLGPFANVASLTSIPMSRHPTGAHSLEAPQPSGKTQGRLVSIDIAATGHTSSLASSHNIRERLATVPPSTSGTRERQQITNNIRNGPTVQGRIAAFEDRLRTD